MKISVSKNQVVPVISFQLELAIQFCPQSSLIHHLLTSGVILTLNDLTALQENIV